MNTYECLQDEACEDGIDVIDYTFHSNRIKGLYCDGVVAIREDMTIPEKTCALAEEIGHHGTSYGNIIDMDSVQNRKQERQARLHGYNRLIGLTGLIRAYEHGCTNRYETAEYRHRWWRDRLAGLNIRQSMSRKGNCIDNAATEQVFGHLKDEFHAGREFASYEQFKNELDAYIIHWNTKRRQIRLEGHTPEEFRNMSPTA